MRKLIRPTYPIEFSVGLLLLIFILACFLSHQIFDVSILDIDQNNVYFGMGLVGTSVIIMVLIVWEEFLFPIKIKETTNGIVTRNHRTKLKTQLLIYCLIPAIFTFIYFEYEINHVRFFIWAAIVTIAPIVEKIASGINNYNDFLKLTAEEIEYKNNKKEGHFKVKDLQNIRMINDEKGVITKIQLALKSGENVIIDLDEMELEAYYDSIRSFITTRYKNMLSDTAASHSLIKE